MGDTDRTSSLLTKSQREFLRGESDLGDRGKRAAKTRIRNRFAAGLEDATLLVRYDEPDDLVKSLDRDELEAGLRSLIALSYRLAQRQGLDFSTLVETGIEAAEQPHWEQVLAKLKADPGAATLDEFWFLISSDEVSSEEVLEEIRAGSGSHPLTFLSADELEGLAEEWEANPGLGTRKFEIRKNQLEHTEKMVEDLFEDLDDGDSEDSSE